MNMIAKRGVKAAEAHIVYGVENKAQYRVSKAWQHKEVDGRNVNDHSEDGCRHRAIGDEAAEEIARCQRRQHRRDQPRPGIDAAAEIGVEIARAEHFETRSRPRWPAPLVEPGAVFAHLLALRCRRVALAVRSLVALGRRAPTQLDAVVGVVRHLEVYRTVAVKCARNCRWTTSTCS